MFSIPRLDRRGPLCLIDPRSERQRRTVCSTARVAEQIGAAIGREFEHELLAAVAPMPQAQLDNSLQRLTESGLAVRRGTPPDAINNFKPLCWVGRIPCPYWGIIFAPISLGQALIQ